MTTMISRSIGRIGTLKNIGLFVFAAWIACGWVVLGWATPPQAMTAHYNLEEQVLELDIEHVSRDVREHYLRKVEVDKNGMREIMHFLHRQEAPKNFRWILPLEAQEGDHLSITVYCSDGGVKNVLYDIPFEQDLKAKQEAEAAAAADANAAP